MGATQFALTDQRSGRKDFRSDSLYLDLQIYDRRKSDQIRRLGLRPGDPILLDRTVKRGFSPDTFHGANLDNGLGCIVTAEVARLVVVAGGTSNVQCLSAIASHSAAASTGFATRNPHTITETAHTGDVLAAVHVLKETIIAMDAENNLRNPFKKSHPRLDDVTPTTHKSFAEHA